MAIAVGMVGTVLCVCLVMSTRREPPAPPPTADQALLERPLGPPARLGTHSRSLRAAESRAIRRVLRYTPYVTRGGRQHRLVALTFDDGPGPDTRALIDTLRRLHAPATFFQVATMVHARPHVARLVNARGFAVGVHTATHSNLAALSPERQRWEIGTSARAIEQTGGYYPRLFRPPYGAFDDATLRELRHRGMLMVLWSVSTRDWDESGSATIVRRVLGDVSPGAIVLMHDGGGATRAPTVAAVPQVVRGLRRRGYRLVTVPELLRLAPPQRPRRPPSPYIG